jgi:phosphate uptake regulator
MQIEFERREINARLLLEELMALDEGIGFRVIGDKLIVHLPSGYADRAAVTQIVMMHDAKKPSRKQIAEAAEAAALQADIDALDTALTEAEVRAIVKRRLLGVQATREGGR